ncbi:TPA: peptidoglycan DD-metalloendopeptidase family protein [Photobacterium damselae]
MSVIQKIVKPVGLIALSSVIFGCSSHTPAPVTSLTKDYSQLARGSFHGSDYVVQKGDTLYFISYIAGQDVKDLIAYNNLTPPYTIYPGQRLNVRGSNSYSTASRSTSTTVTKPVTQTKPAEKKTNNKKVDQNQAKEYSQKATDNKPVTKPTPKPVAPAVTGWLWPAKGKVISRFSSTNKGIDIAGSRGEAVNATAAGKVVYAGNALRGYGNLVIIKHNDDYLSAYAHNDKLLVKEQQQVTAGQKIALMGDTGADSVKLHFEIRYKGKSVDPLRYLPRQ